MLPIFLLQCPQSDLAVSCIAEALRQGHNFAEAELAELQLSAAAQSSMVVALASGGKIARLSIVECALGDEGVGALLPAVRLSSLHTLELRANRIGNHGAGLLAEGREEEHLHTRHRPARAATRTRAGMFARAVAVRFYLVCKLD